MRKLVLLFIAAVFLVSSAPAFAQQKSKTAKAKAKVKAAAKKEITKQKNVFPVADVIKGNETYVVIAELPGVASKDINLEYIEGEKNYLEITGTKNNVALKVKGKKIVSERYLGKFSRKIDLGDRIVKDKISAEFKDNILIITLPILKYQIKTSIKIK
ncbi:MAG: Hsp20/alpha crystallin family protein [Candidatus Aureabacteria bacterium]|nr:Hsp20/alpha crystallin family protein [Candidatus Auribacterota bacterium]